MKKFLAIALSLVMVFGLLAVRGVQAEGMDDLIAAAQKEGELIVYGSCEEEYLAAACEHFQELYGIEVKYQRLSTGEVQSKIEEENGNPSADVWFGGTTDPYNVCAAEGLLEPYEAINASHLLGDAYKDADGQWYGIYKGILGFIVNIDELNRMGLEVPQDWADLLKPEYKDLIWLSNYNTAATAIFKGAAHPNAAKLWIEYALSPDCVELAQDNGSYQFLVIDNAKQPEVATEFGLDPENVMDYDFEDAKNNIKTYIEEVMNALGGGDDRFKTE